MRISIMGLFGCKRPNLLSITHKLHTDLKA
jgi:hypothetical protein